jgi:hypothetical protein
LAIVDPYDAGTRAGEPPTVAGQREVTIERSVVLQSQGEHSAQGVDDAILENLEITREQVNHALSVGVVERVYAPRRFVVCRFGHLMTVLRATEAGSVISSVSRMDPTWRPTVVLCGSSTLDLAAVQHRTGTRSGDDVRSGRPGDASGMGDMRRVRRHERPVARKRQRIESAIGS